MNQFFYRIRCAAARFMYGRNGIDQLSVAMFILEVILYLAYALLPYGVTGAILRFLSTILLLAFLFRFFSKNLDRRRAENAKFLYWFGPRLGGVRDWYLRRADKAHCYSKCTCGAWCRVPRGVGKVEIICPCCGAKKVIKA